MAVAVTLAKTIKNPLKNTACSSLSSKFKYCCHSSTLHHDAECRVYRPDKVLSLFIFTATLAPTHHGYFVPSRGCLCSLALHLALSPSHFTASSSSHGDQSPPLSLLTKIT